jgi:DNA primase
MGVDFDTFLNWAKDRFGEDAVKVKHTTHGDEILTHSFYAHRKGIEDYTYNLWMSPSGGKGKNAPEKGSFRCWKTDTMGSLVRLVADYDGVDYDEAEEQICGGSSLRALEKKVHEFFGHKEEVANMEPVAEETVRNISLPDWSYLIDDMYPSNYWKLKATKYLKARKIPTKGLYICTNGDYKDRIIIPYYDKDGALVWYNARLTYDKKGVIKYMKCKSDGLSITQEDVLYMTAWPEPRTKIYIMEGEIDAMSMHQAGLVACAIGGKFMSETQIEMIRSYMPVLAFDADDGVYKEDSGLQALINVGNQLMERGFSRIGYVRPPKVHKDWNKLLVEKDAMILRAYAERCEKIFTPDTPTRLLAQRLS